MSQTPWGLPMACVPKWNPQDTEQQKCLNKNRLLEEQQCPAAAVDEIFSASLCGHLCLKNHFEWNTAFARCL